MIRLFRLADWCAADVAGLWCRGAGHSGIGLSWHLAGGLIIESFTRRAAELRGSRD